MIKHIATLSALSGAVLGMALAMPAQAQSVGETLFKQRCAACHTTNAGGRAGVGPNLSRVAGRTAAAGAYNYSAALKGARIQWDRTTLNAFLAGPSRMVPGTKMVVQVPDAAQRAQLVAYLFTLKD